MGRFIPSPSLDIRDIPEQPLAGSLGLVRGLKANINDSSYRCAQCNRMQRAGEYIIYVPDGVMVGDPEWSIIKSCGRNPQHSSGWCLSCARRLTPKAKKIRGFFSRLFSKEPNHAN